MACRTDARATQFAAIPVPLNEEDGYHIHPDKVSEEIARGTGVILTSNPRNPAGRVVAGPGRAGGRGGGRGGAARGGGEGGAGGDDASDGGGATGGAAGST